MITRRHLLGRHRRRLAGRHPGHAERRAAAPPTTTTARSWSSISTAATTATTCSCRRTGLRRLPERAPNLALPKASLLALPGSAAGHTFGLHPALAPLVRLYTQERLAFIANVGPLVEPATAAQVLAGTVDVPPFLMSHNDQTAIVQGWTVQDDTSGWAGRALELLPSRLKNRLAAVTSDTNRTLVLGRRSPVSFMDGNGYNSWWGIGDLGRPQDIGAQSLGRMAQWQFANAYEAEYARTYGMAFNDSTFIAQARAAVVEPTADFGSADESGGHEPAQPGLAAAVLQVAGPQAPGVPADLGPLRHPHQPARQRRQHAGRAVRRAGQGTGGFRRDQSRQRPGHERGHPGDDASSDARSGRAPVAAASTPGATTGSPSAGRWPARPCVGRFPSLVLGSADDGDPGKNGRMVPTTSTDQVGATLMQWMGLQGCAVPRRVPEPRELRAEDRSRCCGPDRETPMADIISPPATTSTSSPTRTRTTGTTSSARAGTMSSACTRARSSAGRAMTGSRSCRATESWRSVQAAYWNSPAASSLNLAEGWIDDGYGSRDTVDRRRPAVHGSGARRPLHRRRARQLLLAQRRQRHFMDGGGFDGIGLPRFRPHRRQRAWRHGAAAISTSQVSADGRTATVKPQALRHRLHATRSPTSSTSTRSSLAQPAKP